MKDFIEQQIIEAVRGLLTGRVNEILGVGNFLFRFLKFLIIREGRRLFRRLRFPAVNGLKRNGLYDWTLIQ